MIREGLIAALAIAASVALLDRPAASPAFSDDFDRGIGAAWSARLEAGGRVATVATPGPHATALVVRADPTHGRATAAALIARIAPMRRGETVTIAFDLYVPAATPLDSLGIVDLGCAACRGSDDIGARLYLRRGRLRVDRPAIGTAPPPTRDDAPMLAHDRWHRIVLTARIGAAGAVRVVLDGRAVLAARGATIPPGAGAVDRVRIGITGNANPVPAMLLIDNVAIDARQYPA